MALHIRFLKAVEHIRSSYWFIPALMALAGLVAGLGLVLLDSRVGDAWLGRVEWFYGSRPEGARAVLSTIASSTITVAGVVFSITLAAVIYASGQYGPRLLTNFQRDRGNQVTLGTFIATFLYCLIVLRTIRSAEEASADTAGALREAFVPHLAIYGALLLALASIAMLIYFVHHVTDSIHINNVIARIGQRLIDDIRCLPKATDDTAAPPSNPGGMQLLRATATGYIQAIDRQALLRLACKHELILRILRRPGDFVHSGLPLIEVLPASAAGPQLAEACQSAFAIANRRTPLQDLRFGIDELVEITARALSPGINDPFTAIACLDWLGAAMMELDQRRDRQAAMIDKHDQLRVLADPLTFADHLAAGFGQVRPYVAANPTARVRALATLSEVANAVRNPAHRALLLAEHERLAACAHVK